MKIKNIELIIERSEDSLFGRVLYNNNLIVDEAETVQNLETQIKHLLHDIEGLEPEDVTFDVSYDIQVLFDQFDFLNISKIAKHADMNPALLRHYANGQKFPSAKQAKKIQDTIHRLASQMQKASIYAD